MNRFRLILVLPLLLLAGSPAAPPTPAQPAARLSEPPKPSYDDYRLINDRNIFSKDRSRSSRPERYERPSSTTARPAYTPPPVRGSDASVVLAGVAVHQGAEMAFFEDRRTGDTCRVPTGQSVAGGKVLSICLDSVEYCRDNTTRTIRVGETLAGDAAAMAGSSATTQPAAGGSAATQPAGAAGDTPADKAANDILERMRLRRLQELKQ